MITGAVRHQLFQISEPAKICYMGGVFNSHILRERYQTLVELVDGNQCSAPLHGPAAGALLEAYRAAGLYPKLKRFPE